MCPSRRIRRFGRRTDRRRAAVTGDDDRRSARCRIGRVRLGRPRRCRQTKIAVEWASDRRGLGSLAGSARRMDRAGAAWSAAAASTDEDRGGMGFGSAWIGIAGWVCAADRWGLCGRQRFNRRGGGRGLGGAPAGRRVGRRRGRLTIGRERGLRAWCGCGAASTSAARDTSLSLASACRTDRGPPTRRVQRSNSMGGHRAIPAGSCAR